ncbi:MAG: hypothetical protein Q4C52_13665 [Eubacteriales bacterium]|nr:hypothetical protein [Eubacteriales bacterium]
MKKKNPKQIAALVCVVILVALYLLTLIFAIADFPGWQRMFGGCLVGTIALPILLWVYIWLYGKIKDRHTIASFDIGGPEHMDEKEREALNAKAAKADWKK